LARVSRLSGGVWVTLFVLTGVGSLALAAISLGLVAAARDSALF